MRQEYQTLKSKIAKLKVGEKKQKKPILVRDHLIGAGNFTIIAGPCAVENLTQMEIITQAVKKAGAHILRGGVFKPRTSPYSFQGLGLEGLALLTKMREQHQIPTITEVMCQSQLLSVAKHTDIIQIGSRNMQNFALLEAVGKISKPVLLKRGLASTLEEFLLAAEYILNAGNPQVILCERGIRTYETATRNTLDLNAVAILKNITHLPVFVDPSHGTGITEIMLPMTQAALACGADGIMLEVHHSPENALSDGDQALTPSEFHFLVQKIHPLVQTLKKEAI